MTTMQTDSVLSFSPVASIQPLGDGAVILLADSGQLYTCNDTTESMLQLVDGRRTLAEIIDRALEEFEVDRPTLERDFFAIASELVQEGILTA